MILSVFFGSSIDMRLRLPELTYPEVLANYFKIFIENFKEYSIWILFDLVLAGAFVGTTIFFNFKHLNVGREHIKKL